MPDGLPHELTPPFEFSLAYAEPGRVLEFGDSHLVYPYKSVTKLFSAWATLVAVEQSYVDLDDEVAIGADGERIVTLRHLLAHASGLSFGSDTLEAEPEEKRIYSNRGIEMAASHVEKATGTEFARWTEEAVLEPLGLIETLIDGSAAHAGEGSIRDLLVFARELLKPSLISAELADEARSTVFPGLRGLTPGFGSYSDNTWGLGLEIKNQKVRTWFPRGVSADTFGHFGQSGSFLWVEPQTGRTAAFLGSQPFGAWHKKHWQNLGDYFLETY
ncbi:MAG: serine hydrolase domain-containing protein [Actinomycetaceae bacterium]|nr:serine hydrolase domain-containing protein [Actinomycetaceae bacterium]